MPSPGYCRDCLAPLAGAARRCMACGSPRIVVHAELDRLAIAHIDCDAFYAAIEKRDNPALADKPLIVGGGRRGVVSTCCYIARTRGVTTIVIDETPYTGLRRFVEGDVGEDLRRKLRHDGVEVIVIPALPKP